MGTRTHALGEVSLNFTPWPENTNKTGEYKLAFEHQCNKNG